MKSDEEWMAISLEEASRASSIGEVPVGCVLVGPNDEEVARGHNLRESALDPTAHAEMIAIRAAAAKLARWRLDDLTAYVTLEPCAMCAGALVLARVRRVVYGCDDPKAGACGSVFSVGLDEKLNHRFELTKNVRGDECSAALKAFFAGLRAQGKRG
ncbi:MAG: nucleoside deaminase [Myxococcales bacterium]|jgi:tRNA(adenine34) deaminase|nr:nucleoside deaminase [Myxococcales bacterium]